MVTLLFVNSVEAEHIVPESAEEIGEGGPDSQSDLVKQACKLFYWLTQQSQ